MASTKCSGLSNSTPPPHRSTMSGKRLAESSPMKTTFKLMSPFFSTSTTTTTTTTTTNATVNPTTIANNKPRANTIKPTPKSKSSATTTPVSSSSKAAVIDWQLNKPEVIRVEALNIHYTSLRDIMPAAMLLQQQQQQQSKQQDHPEVNLSVCCGGSPTTRTRMKNHLVEQAARAYLQPLNLECTKSTQFNFFPWNWQKLMGYTPLMTFGCSGYAGGGTSSMIKSFFSSFTKISLSRTLRYLLGRVRPQPMIGFLQQPRIIR